MYTAHDHTFVICAYKENPFLGETISSLQRQSVTGKILLSTSTPNNYVSGVCKQYGIEMIINPDPRLAGDDWNYGYDQAETSLVTIAHQDDYYEPLFLERMLAALNSYDSQEVSLAYSDYYEIRENERVTGSSILKIKQILNSPLRFKALNHSRFIKKRVLSLGCPICCPSVMLVKSNIGASVFDTNFKNSCDYKTWVDLAFKPGRFIYIPEQLLGHRIYAESATSRNIQEDVRRKDDLEILSLLWPRPIARMVNAVYAKSEKSNQLSNK